MCELKEKGDAKGCGGQCCERFLLPEPIEHYKKEYLNWKKAKEGESLEMNGKIRLGHGTFYHKDIELIYPMLIYLGEQHFEPYAPEVKTEYVTHHYTCKHFNLKTRLCTIYDIRPDMCRNYPNAEHCLYPGCRSYPQKPKKALGGKYPKIHADLGEEMVEKADAWEKAKVAAERVRKEICEEKG